MNNDPIRTIAMTAIAGLILSASATHAAVGDPITLLDLETSVSDRQATSDKLLSEILDADVQQCRVDNQQKDNKFYNCIKKEVSGYKKSKYIDSAEKSELYDVVALVRSGEVEVSEPPATVLATLNIRVTEPDGSPVYSVNASSADTGTEFGTTDNEGRVTISTLEAGTSTVLRFASPGYAEQIVPVATASGAQVVSMEVTMIPQEDVELNVIDGMAMATSTDGASVSFAPGSFITEAGQVVSDELINVTMASVNVSNSAELSAFPGSFTGDDGTTMATIASLGTTEYTFSTTAGDGTETSLQLSPDATATIMMPIYMDTRPDTNEQVVAGSSIALWSLTEATGIWLQEGQGTVVESSSSPTGLALEAEVSHFTWWNIDVAVETGEMSVSVTAPVGGTAIVTGVPSDIAWRTAYSTQAVGSTSQATTPAGTEICYSAEIRFESGQIGTTNTVCQSVLPGGTQDVLLTVLSADAPLTIAANVPADSADVVSVAGFINNPIRRVLISPLSIESGVTYSTSDPLPAGMQLVQTSVYFAEVVGIPTVSGVFDIQLNATNTDGESDSISLQYNISGDEAPVESVTATINGNFEQNDFDLNELASVPPTSWEIIGPDALPTGMTFNSESGILRIPYSLLFDNDPDFWNWNGIVRANYEGGISVDYDLTIVVTCDFCGPR